MYNLKRIFKKTKSLIKQFVKIIFSILKGFFLLFVVEIYQKTMKLIINKMISKIEISIEIDNFQIKYFLCLKHHSNLSFTLF